jgi:hypothetical protein
MSQSSAYPVLFKAPGWISAVSRAFRTWLFAFVLKMWTRRGDGARPDGREMALPKCVLVVVGTFRCPPVWIRQLRAMGKWWSTGALNNAEWCDLVARSHGLLQGESNGFKSAGALNAWVKDAGDV